MATINVGPAATNRASVTASGNTVLDLANPAGGTGTITAIDVYVANQTTNTKIGIFYLVSGTTYKCRSSTGDLGVLTTGLKQFTGLSLAVQSGDFIGLWHNGGGIDRADSGGTSAYKSGDYANMGDETSYTTASQTRIVSVHGTGTTVTAYTLACSAGSYSLTGTNADFFAAIKPATDAMLTNQAFGWFGFPVGGFPLVAVPVNQDYSLTCEAGSYSLTGTNADLTVTRHYTLTCEAGSYALTGTNADLTVKRNYVLNAVYPDMIVSGAENSAANGTYVAYEPEDEEGRAEYLNDLSIILWDDDRWLIYNGWDGSFKYYCAEDVATPDLCSSWIDDLTEEPSSLTVTAANAYKLTGTDATLTVQRNYVLACSAGLYSLTGSIVDLTVQRNYVLACSAGNYLITGTDATLTVERNYTLVCEPGSYTLTGTDITFGNSKAYSLTCEAGAYTLTGSSVSFVIQRNYSLACETGSYSLTGTDANLVLLRNYILACEAGSYALTGTNADLTVQRNYTLECASGSYSLTGSDVTLDPTFHYSLTLESGSYTLTGTDVTLTKTTGAQSYTLVCSAGSYALTGTNAALTSARTMALESGSYALTGTNAGLYRALVMACEAGSYALTGSDATFNANYVFALGVGSYVLVGTACGLFILSPTPACRTATIEFENRTFAIPHEDRTATIEYENRTFAIPHEDRTATIEYENRTLEVKCH